MTFRFKPLGVAAILAASVSTAALAEAEAGLGADVNTDVTANEDGASVGAGVDTGVTAGSDTTAQVGADSDLNATGETGTATEGATTLRAGANVDIEGLEDGVAVDTVTVSEMNVNQDSLDAVTNEFGGELTSMREQIDANADLMAALEAEGYSSEDVVSVWQTAEGSVSVLVDDRS
ncbi:hypothetical protein [Pseudooceanicola aestuarii]|uniref:hypothetical protein n=1 Tax=Pseudooceanicola aestuarii TaxID=2697319 RepID=UPI0013D5AADF|nr:hypothetical protein [Pseudooceanicola aestuarii]